MNLLPGVEVTPRYFAFGGGLNLVTSEADKAPGALLGCLNYEPALDGGYSRIAGFERRDGRTSPSSAAITPIACAITSVPAAGTAVVIGSVTALFVGLIDGGALLMEASGTPAPTQIITVGGSPVGSTGSSTVLPYPITAALEAQWLVDAAAVYRAAITAVPGEGPVRGVWLYNGVDYAFRNASGGATCGMYKSTAAGWVAVALGEEITFSNANTGVGEGDTLTQGGATATIARVVLQTGSLSSGTNTGRLILTGRGASSFAAGAATTTGAGALTLAGVQTAITLPPGGAYKFRNWNFFGQASSRRMYGVNGVGRAFEFDGTVFVPLSTGAAVDTPSCIEANRARLFLGQASSVMFSSPTSPYIYDATQEAGEIAAGDIVTEIRSLPGKAVGVFTRNSTQAITGATKAEFVLEMVAPDTGSVGGIVGVLTETFMLDDRGVVSLRAVADYGNFAHDTVSRRIQPLVNSLRPQAITSVVVRAKDLMRIFCSDGRVLTMRPAAKRAPEFTSLDLGVGVASACCEEDSSGDERVLVGSTDGFVYEMDKGSTFDGLAIESFLRTTYFNARAPRVRKHFRFAAIEMVAELRAQLSFMAEFSGGDPGTQSTSAPAFEVVGGGGQWDVSSWDSVFWDTRSVTVQKVRTEGSGSDMAMTFYSNTQLDFGHTLQGATVHYTARRLNR